METNRFEKMAKIILYVIAGALPLWFVPWPIGIEFGREITFGVLIVLAAIFWLLSVLKTGEIRWSHSPILYASALLFLVFVLSTAFSKAPSVSFLFADPVGERLSTLILGLILMFLAGSVLRTREEAGKAVWILVLAGATAGILSLLQIFGWSPYQLSIINDQLSFLRGIDFNVIGTLNGLSLFYGALFMVAVGTAIVTGRRLLLIIASAIFLATLLFINFHTSWVALLGSEVLLFGLLFRKARGRLVSGEKAFDWRYWAVLVLLVFSVVMIMVRTPIFAVNLPAEVSPTPGATLRTAFSSFGEGTKAVLLGSGPGTFGLDWSRYKDPSINQTIFWSIRFNQGSSYLATLLATTGLLGFFSFLIFIGAAILLFLKKLLNADEKENALARSIFLGFAAVAISLLFYAANFSMLLFLFFLMGVLTSVLARKEEGSVSFWDITERSYKFETPTAVFVSSLAAVFLVALGVAALYTGLGRVRSALTSQQGARELARGATHDAISYFERAASFEQKNFRHQQALLAARAEKIRVLIQRAAQGENVQQEFQQEVGLAVQNAQRAISLNPEEPSTWRMQGGLYEIIIPFINGAERFAFSSYQKAAELDPLNPGIYIDWGRAGLVFADRLQLAVSQSSAGQREEILKARIATLQEAERVFQKAVAVKPDLATAHFLLAQTAIRLGNVQAAIQSAENARTTAPFDIGVAFQLGLLYYQNDDLDRAEAEFLRAVAINPNYSNARYFLGLIYDRQGRKKAAIEEFEKAAVFNPDNEEIQKILSNLRKGKKALAGITPPAEPPERRRETPVR